MPDQSGDLVLQARAIAHEANLRIYEKRTTLGAFVEWRVYRGTRPQMTFVGARSDAEKLLSLVRRCAGERKQKALLA